jgi:hypothetical protein
MCLLVSWCVDDRCGIASSDKDRGRNRRLDAEDQGWSSTGQVLSDQMIERSSDVVCGLHRAQGDEKRGFLGLASKSSSTVSPSLASNPMATVCQWFGLKTTAMIFPGLASKSVVTVYQWFGIKIIAMVSWFGSQNLRNQVVNTLI